jgi:hypothetical protein
MTYINVIADNDVDFYLYALAIMNGKITTPQTKQIGKYSVIWQKYIDGTLTETVGMKQFLPFTIETITETMITNQIEDFHKKYTYADETERSKNKAIFDRRFEAGRKIVTEKEEKQTAEHIELIYAALKKNPAIISVAFKEHPEVLKNILQAILPSILQGILPTVLRAELQDLRKELTSSLHTKLPEIIRAMVQ